MTFCRIIQGLTDDLERSDVDRDVLGRVAERAHLDRHGQRQRRRRVLHRRRRAGRRGAPGAGRPQPRAADAAALRQALDRRRRDARGLRRDVPHREDRHRSRRRDHPLDRLQHHRLDPGLGRPGGRGGAGAARRVRARPRRRWRDEAARPHPDRDGHPVRRDAARSTSRRACAWRGSWSTRGNDGVVVSGTTGESPALETDEKLALFAEIKRGAGRARHGRSRAPAATTRATRSSSRSRREQCGADGDPRRRAVLQQADAGRDAAALRRDRRGDGAAGRRLQHPRPHRREHAARDVHRADAAGTRTSPGSRSRPATSTSSPRSCASARART